MASSPTMCQLYVQMVLEPVKKQFPSLVLIHYMYDILMCHKELTVLQTSYPLVSKRLEQWGLHIATEKVQISEIGSFLGTIIYPE